MLPLLVSFARPVDILEAAVPPSLSSAMSYERRRITRPFRSE